MTRKKAVQVKMPLKYSKNFVVWLALGLLFAARIFVALQASGSGSRLAQLEQKKESLIEENKSLETSIVKMSSLTNLSTQAQELGYVKADSFFYIKSQDNFSASK